MMEKIGDYVIAQARVRKHACPGCHTVMDGVTSVTRGEITEPPVPKAGDLSICTYCQSVNIFQADGTLRFATNEECQDVPLWARIRMMEKKQGPLF